MSIENYLFMISQKHLPTAETRRFATSLLLTQTLGLVTIFGECHIVNSSRVSYQAYINRYDMYIYLCKQQGVRLLLVHEIHNNSAVT